MDLHCTILCTSKHRGQAYAFLRLPNECMYNVMYLCITCTCIRVCFSCDTRAKSSLPEMVGMYKVVHCVIERNVQYIILYTCVHVCTCTQTTMDVHACTLCKK